MRFISWGGRMITSTIILWEAAGRPPGRGEATGLCCICGQKSFGLPFQQWVRPTFTDWDKILHGDIICQRCQFAFEEQSILLAEKLGKDKPQRMRNYSHFVVSGQWVPLSKSEKSRMVEILRGEFDLAVIAVSGQKHILFRAVPRIVQYEEQRLHDLPTALRLLGPVTEMYTAGFSKQEIASGRYHPEKLIAFPKWYELERELRPHRGSLAFEMAIFLAQREEPNGEQHSGIGISSPAGDLAGNPRWIQKPLSGHHLAAV